MEKEHKYNISMKNKTQTMEAKVKKAHLVSSIIEKSEQGEEEENKGRS